ncbi:MAG: D-alanyl-D-alanine carboxypeptidase [Hellea sp.]
MLRMLISFMFAVMLCAPSLAADAPRRYASIVVDADSLEIIHARQIDDLRYPASLTKVMTLYLTFDALNAGRLKLNEPIRVSANAANTPPTKLGLRAGSTITVENLIQALAVKSANDAAVVLAERLAGSEEAFAVQMSAKAQSLGMTKTTFKTANGLPHPDQRTSARDMAKLASNILSNHRRYYHYFGQQHFRYGGRSYKNTNGLLHWLDGVDGFKTGYTRDSGYNLIVSAQRDGRRLIAVVLGGASGASRNSHMQDLIERGFNVMGVAPAKNLPPIIINREAVPERAAPHVAVAPKVSSAVRLRGRDQKPVTVSNDQKLRLSEFQSDKAWGIQIGAYLKQSDAQDQIAAVGGLHILSKAKSNISPLTRNGQTLYRARFEGLSVKDAQSACKALAKLSSGCLIVASN